MSKSYFLRELEKEVLKRLNGVSGRSAHSIRSGMQPADRPLADAAILRLKRAGAVAFKDGLWTAVRKPAPPKSKAELTEAEKGVLLSLKVKPVRYLGAAIKKTAEPLLRMGLVTVEKGATKGRWLKLTAAGDDALTLFLGQTLSYERIWQDLGTVQKQDLLNVAANEPVRFAAVPHVQSLIDLALVQVNKASNLVALTPNGKNLVNITKDRAKRCVEIWSLLTLAEQNAVLKVALSKEKVRWGDISPIERGSLCANSKEVPALLACNGKFIHLTAHGKVLVNKLEMRDIARDAHKKGAQATISTKSLDAEEAGKKVVARLNKNLEVGKLATKPEHVPVEKFADATRRKNLFEFLLKQRLEELHRGSTIHSTARYVDGRKMPFNDLKKIIGKDIDNGLLEHKVSNGAHLFRLTDKGINAFAKMDPDVFFKLNERSALRCLEEVTKSLEKMKREQQLKVMAAVEFVPLYTAVMNWWASYRPVGRTEQEHFDMPHVNMTRGQFDHDLADELLRIRKEARG